MPEHTNILQALPCRLALCVKRVTAGGKSTCGKLGTRTPTGAGGERAAAMGHLMDEVEMKQVRCCLCASLAVCLSSSISVSIVLFLCLSLSLSLFFSLLLSHPGY